MVKEWRGRKKNDKFSYRYDSNTGMFQLLATESRIQETYDDDVATLVIKKVKLEDDGEYICRATNDEGSDTSSAQVTVKGNATICPSHDFIVLSFSSCTRRK